MLGTTSSTRGSQSERRSPLATPVLHHVHQNSTDPAAAIAEFQKIYPALVKVTVGGFEGVQIPNVMSILFTKVNAPAPTQPQSAFLRHVFSVPNVRELVKQLRSIKMDVRATCGHADFVWPLLVTACVANGGGRGRPEETARRFRVRPCGDVVGQ